MSQDLTEFLDASRPEEPHVVIEDGIRLRSTDNPLTKGLVVLVMIAVATTVLVATRDDDSVVVASDVIASEPLGPETEVDGQSDEEAEVDGQTDDGATASTVAPASGDSSAEPWAASQVMGLPSASAEQMRQQLLGQDSTTTTEEPTTTAAPTTAAPTTAAPQTTTTAAAETTAAPDTSATEASTTEASTTETTAGDGGSGEPGTEDTTTTVVPTTAAPAETTTSTAAASDGWVDAGHGVLVPPVLLAIRYCESRDNYQAANPSSSARGAYQFLTGSWAAYGHADRYGVSQAHLATNAQQDEAALVTWQRDGTRPWNASRSCWSQRI